jgi:hypothetical protein
MCTYTSEERKKMNKGKCRIKFCRHKRSTKSSMCCTHKSQKYRKENPERYAYRTAMDNAKRRCKEFTITFQYFVDLLESEKQKGNDYLKYKGINGFSLSLDRIENDKGYVNGNIQILTVSDNSRKAQYAYCPF